VKRVNARRRHVPQTRDHHGIPFRCSAWFVHRRMNAGMSDGCGICPADAGEVRAVAWELPTDTQGVVRADDRRVIPSTPSANASIHAIAPPVVAATSSSAAPIGLKTGAALPLATVNAPTTSSLPSHAQPPSSFGYEAGTYNDQAHREQPVPACRICAATLGALGRSLWRPTPAHWPGA